ncbi:DUF3093 domain-containing protein [Kitasatospora sp. NBC_01287]|uniref:DUF3093 domain-containing protein n=1 Tax=Kitasatospora sp. NBC_01287 TaxID=2903573 RepID=UPI0022562B96|nr:DUF3093 domain-containing protein [Kitasatospora sp. NBC_01287]MCX4746439.1 DUF3093 domain-containing protein [Kitasatospora sp. NBC_01287]
MGGMYDERLTAPRSWWLLPVGAGLSIGLVLLKFGSVPGLIGLVVGLVAAAIGLSSYGSARIRVVQGSLVAGQARIPLTALGEARPLDAAEAVAWRSVKADPRAFMLLRSYVPTALRVEITDPDDPTPYLYLSTRDPRALAAAIGAAQA